MQVQPTSTFNKKTNTEHEERDKEFTTQSHQWHCFYYDKHFWNNNFKNEYDRLLIP